MSRGCCERPCGRWYWRIRVDCNCQTVSSNRNPGPRKPTWRVCPGQPNRSHSCWSHRSCQHWRCDDLRGRSCRSCRSRSRLLLHRFRPSFIMTQMTYFSLDASQDCAVLRSNGEQCLLDELTSVGKVCLRRKSYGSCDNTNTHG